MSYLSYRQFKNYSQYTFISNIFNEGIVVEFDNLIKDITNYKRKFEQLRTELINLCKPNDKTVDIKFDCTNKYGYSLELTEKRANLLKKKIKNIKEYEHVFFEKRNSNVIIKTAEIKEASNKIILIEEKLFNLTKIEFKNRLSKYTTDYYLDNFKLLNKIIADIDIYKSYSKLAVLDNYCRPIIENKYEEQSYLKLYDLRHPIVEIIHSEYEYIPNDVELSGDVKDGMLVFGPNATGKSTIMKSTGIAIIMAQCGMFVPCSRMIYYPYKKMFKEYLEMIIYLKDILHFRLK